jgi:chromate transport protein ChrA
MSDDIIESVKHATDALSVFTVLATLAQWLPSIAALFTLIWTMIRIYETRTVQRWLKRGD